MNSLLLIATQIVQDPDKVVIVLINGALPAPFSALRDSELSNKAFVASPGLSSVTTFHCLNLMPEDAKER